MSTHERAVADPDPASGLTPRPNSTAGDDEDYGAELSDEELGELLVREITIDGMCGVY